MSATASVPAGAVDSYQVSGTITEFVVTDGYEVSVRLDGEPVSVADLVGDGEDTSSGDSGNGGSDSGPGDDADSESPKVLVIDGNETPGEPIEYEFTVTGDLSRYAERSLLFNEELTADLTADSIDGSRAVGAVGDGRDVFRFTGKVQSLSLSGAGVVEVHDE